LKNFYIDYISKLHNGNKRKIELFNNKNEKYKEIVMIDYILIQTI